MQSTVASSRLRFWASWVAANAAGEALGLGTVFAVGVLATTTMGDPVEALGLAVLAGLVIVLAVFEGAVVGVAQWLVLHRLRRALRAVSWVGATVVGAVVAWLLGLIPSTVADLSQASASAAPPPEPSEAVVLLLAAALGFVLGLVLSSAQWWVLRSHVERAGWWLPANGLAWAAAMPLIFWLVGATIAEHQSPAAVAQLAVGIALAGAVVGAIHGAFLVWLLAPARGG